VSEDINRWIRERAARQRLIPECLRQERDEKPKEESHMNALIRRVAGRGEADERQG
jgi:hypothetical protein